MGLFSFLFGRKGHADKRRSKRIPFMNPLRIAYWKPEEDRIEYGEVEDLSLHGLLFAAYGRLKKGTRIHLQLELPVTYEEERILRVEAVVVRCAKTAGQKRNRFGCEFINVTPEIGDKIAKFLATVKKVHPGSK